MYLLFFYYCVESVCVLSTALLIFFAKDLWRGKCWVREARGERRGETKKILAQVCEKTGDESKCVCVCVRLRLVRLWWCVLRRLLRVGQARWTGVCLGGTKNPGGKVFP